MFAQVFIDTNTQSIDSIYTYIIPERFEEIVTQGMRVIVPFGSGNRPYQALVMGITDTIDFDESKAKPILDILDVERVVPEYLIDTAVFLRERYFCTYSDAIKTILPSIDKIKRFVVYNTDQTTDDVADDPIEKLILNELIKNKDIDISRLRAKLNIERVDISQALGSLVKKGLARTDEIFEHQFKPKEEIYLTLAPGFESADDVMNAISPRAVKQREAALYVLEHDKNVRRADLVNDTQVSASAIDALCDKSILIPVSVEKDYSKDSNVEKVKDHELTDEQKRVYTEFNQYSDEGDNEFLLFGVTGSGKTRVFFEMFDDMLEKGKQCLLLVPEIALTPQMMRLVEQRFNCVVAIMHSKLTQTERYSQFLKIRSGEAKIVLGARSALFMPFKDLGMIVIDEEHETSYKSSQSPRYETNEVARFIQSKTNCKLILSSATPSTQTFYRAMKGDMKILRLPTRVNNIPLPQIEIQDMRTELKSGNRSPISRKLKALIDVRLNEHQQSILFLNRRGFTTSVVCRSCGYVVKCPNCDVAMTYHMNSSRLTCHYCGHTEYPPTKCPECGSDKIKFMGAGTEKIEEEVRKLFPSARVARVDSDVPQKTREELLEGFFNDEYDIMIGTQMIVKGLDYPLVTLTGILLADTSLNFPDLNASARTYQLTSQAAGRSGRRGLSGNVVIQTYNPSAPTLVYCALNDYEGFYGYDIAHRQEMWYPPFCEILGIFTGNEDSQKAYEDCEKASKLIKDLTTKNDYGKIKIYETSPASIQKLKNKYIYHTLICYEPDSNFAKDLRKEYPKLVKKVSSTMYVEIDPVTML